MEDDPPKGSPDRRSDRHVIPHNIPNRSPNLWTIFRCEAGSKDPLIKYFRLDYSRKWIRRMPSLWQGLREMVFLLNAEVLQERAHAQMRFLPG